MIDNCPNVCIVLVNYNGANDTVDCIKSIQKSLYTNINIVVVDNKSSDDSIRILLKFESDKIHIIANDINSGFAKANNIGIKYAMQKNYEYIILLNNDTVVLPNSIGNLIVDFEKIKYNAVFTGKILYYYKKDIIWYGGGLYNFWKGTPKHLFGNKSSCEYANSMTECNFATGCYIALRTKDIEKIGFIPEEYFLYSEDVAYSLQIRNKGFKIIYDPNSVIYHKVSSSTSKNSESTTYYLVRNRLMIIRKYHHGLYKVSAYIYSLFVFIKAVIKGNMNKKSVLLGIKDFLGKNREIAEGEN